MHLLLQYNKWIYNVNQLFHLEEMLPSDDGELAEWKQLFSLNQWGHSIRLPFSETDLTLLSRKIIKKYLIETKRKLRSHLFHSTFSGVK